MLLSWSPPCTSCGHTPWCPPVHRLHTSVSPSPSGTLPALALCQRTPGSWNSVSPGLPRDSKFKMNEMCPSQDLYVHFSLHIWHVHTMDMSSFHAHQDLVLVTSDFNWTRTYKRIHAFSLKHFEHLANIFKRASAVQEALRVF